MTIELYRKPYLQVRHCQRSVGERILSVKSPRGRSHWGVLAMGTPYGEVPRLDELGDVPLALGDQATAASLPDVKLETSSVLDQ